VQFRDPRDEPEFCNLHYYYYYYHYYYYYYYYYYYHHHLLSVAILSRIAFQDVE
jgi:hypothetical protein